MVDKFNLVFLVDDDEVVIYLSNILLNKMSFSEEVRTFSNAERGLDSLKQISAFNGRLPDLILLDIHMPTMNGWAFLDEMKRNKIKVPVFILTSSVDPKDKVKALTYRTVKGFITKPLTKFSLDKIRRILDDCMPAEYPALNEADLMASFGF